MTEEKSKLIHQLFDNYASSLTNHASSYKDEFACPICFSHFRRNAINSGEITIEHIVPSSIGGRLVTLTCKRCNNSAGTDLDAHLVRRINAEDKFAGKSDSPLRGKIKAGDGEFAADVFFSNVENVNENIRIDVTPLAKHSNPKLHDLAKRKMASTDPKKLLLNFSLQYSRIPSLVAVIRSAYLMMFRYFGYGYIKHEVLDIVREQIANPMQETEVLLGLKSIQGKPEVENDVAVLTYPEHLRCFFVILNLSTKVDRYQGVILPGLELKEQTIYKRWANVKLEESIIQLPNCPYHPAHVYNPKYKYLPNQIWHYKEW